MCFVCTVVAECLKNSWFVFQDDEVVCVVRRQLHCTAATVRCFRIPNFFFCLEESLTGRERHFQGDPKQHYVL